MREHNSVKDNKDICERGYELRQDEANQVGEQRVWPFKRRDAMR